jgi:formylglycine-generating enzyme required for sulfatase activity
VLLGLQTLQTMRHLERGGLFGMAHRLTELHLAEGTPPPPRPEHREELAMRLREYTSILAQRGRMEALLAAPPRSTRSGDWSDEASLDAPLHAALSATVDLLAKMNRPGAEFDQLRLRVDWAARVTERTIDAHRADWERVCREVHDEPRYGFDLTPQVGLVPLGPDPVTHLQEFALLLPDGEVPQRVDGKLVLGPRTCPVFVLLPGGKVMLGGQNTDPADIHYDQRLSPTEDPLVDATLPPFFAGKFEFTNGHWALALGGKHHSEPPELYDDPLRPVVNLDEDWMTQVLLAWGMRFPTWQEWEYLARGGTDTPFAYGTDNASLRGHANLLDLTARAAEPSLGEGEPEQWPDNFERTAPVGSFPPNGFGLYDVHGNALEPALRLELDGQRQFDLRGGSWNQPAIRARILFAPKWTQGPMESIGFRPVISVSR